MAITKATITGMADLAAWLSENACPDYFDRVTWANSCLTCADADGNTLFSWSSSDYAVYKVPGGSAEIGNACSGDMISVNHPATAAKCGGGILITLHYTSSGYTYFAHIVFTRTNSGQLAVIAVMAPDGSNGAAWSNIHSAAIGDAADTAKLISFTPSAQNQTLLVPFTTYAKPDTVSYTPHAFYMPVGEYYGIGYGKFTAGGETYITNGCWAVRD